MLEQKRTAKGGCMLYMACNLYLKVSLHRSLPLLAKKYNYSGYLYVTATVFVPLKRPTGLCVGREVLSEQWMT